MPVIINGSTGISGTDGSAGTPAVQGTDTNTGMYFPAADQIAFAEGGVEAMRLDASGNVGIGTTTPGQRLQISNASSSGFAAVRMATDARAYDVGVGGSASGFQQNNWYIFDVTAGAPRVVVDSSGNFQFNSGYGSVATAYGCRAWVNFNGTGTVAIRASGGVSSITDVGTGSYRMNFAVNFPDVNYSSVGSATDTGNWGTVVMLIDNTVSYCGIATLFNNGTGYGDPAAVCFAFFR